jgi:hypothetical protein
MIKLLVCRKYLLQHDLPHSPALVVVSPYLMLVQRQQQTFVVELEYQAKHHCQIIPASTVLLLQVIHIGLCRLFCI